MASRDANMLEQTNCWPVKCICNLCDCGGHSCATFEPVSLSRAQSRTPNAESRPSAIRENRELLPSVSFYAGTGHNETDHQRARGNRSSQSPATMMEHRRLIETNQEEILSAGGSRGACDHGGNAERYLTSQTPLANGRTPEVREEEQDGPLGGCCGAAEDDELLHVLVTKPEIASKPRDNIIFEGDMDLRTTFETSYEALARMRLDHFKRHQQAGAKGGGQNRQPSPKRGPQIMPDGNKSSVSVAAEMIGNQEQLPKRSTDRERGSYSPYRADQVSPGVMEGTLSELAGHRQVASSNVAASDSERRLLSNATSNEESPEAYSGALQNSTQLDKVARPQTQLKAREPVNNCSPNEANSSGNDIDPDLSSIIVYNANMNRLDKVGLRKRSKFRPSTSLRAGARGLFGDQDELKSDEQYSRPQQAVATVAPIVRRDQSNDSRQREDLKKMTLNQQQTIPWRPPMSSRSEQKLHARNLADSYQPDSLTFSGHNLPVESKRRVEDNVNMHDHIKEQNIVETTMRTPTQGQHRPMSPAKSPLVIDEQLAEMSEGKNGQDYQQQTQVEDLRLAQNEERAAIEELQRITNRNQSETPNRQPISQHHHRKQQQNQPPIEDEKNSRRSRLDRTCQNQSFHLGQNDYPDAKQLDEKNKFKYITTGDSSQGAHNHSGHRSRNYTNLFRESPDFIFTTGKFQEDERDAARASSLSFSHPLSNLNASETTPPVAATRFGSELVQNQNGLRDPGSSPFEMGIPISDCRVLKLEDDFKYVGTRSGHKYFVEQNS